jgi:hypothetical protein
MIHKPSMNVVFHAWGCGAGLHIVIVIYSPLPYGLSFSVMADPRNKTERSNFI